MKATAGEVYTVYNQYLKRYTACQVAYIAPPDSVSKQPWAVVLSLDWVGDAPLTAEELPQLRPLYKDFMYWSRDLHLLRVPVEVPPQYTLVGTLPPFTDQPCCSYGGWSDGHDVYLQIRWQAIPEERRRAFKEAMESDEQTEIGGIPVKVSSHRVMDQYQEAGYKVLNRTDDASIEALIARMKAEGREKEIQKELKKLKNLKQTNIPKALAYVSGELFEQYIHDMKIVQHFAMLNRQAMMDEIVKGMKLHVEEQFTTIHNYIDTDAMILRKGAVSAKEGERLLIPINMRDGSLLCVGKGNEDWNCSAPHGAGRLMSRADAKQSFTVSEFKKQMAEVYTTSVSKATLDECPMAYKGMQDILDNIGPTADVVKVIRPIYNFKAGDEE